jgi:hypothetical protein
MWKRIAFLVLLLAPFSSNAQVIGFQDCIHSASIGVQLDLILQYTGPEGIMGADVRVTGLPTAWIRIPVPPPHINPCGTEPCDLFIQGANLVFPTCTDPKVQLFLIQVIPTTDETDLVVTPEAVLGSPMGCPSVTLCDDPVFTVQCVGCDQAFINHSNPICPTPVQDITWTSVRQLYQ